MKREVVMCGVPFDDPNVRDYLRKMKEDGVTSVQIYVHWNKYEPERRGEFDFSYYDSQVNLLKEAGLKFVPFILIGPRYAAPKWWLEDKNHKGLVCLEHGIESPIDSIWNEAFREEIDRVLKVFTKHYLDMDVLESVQPGICGDYGESIMPVFGNWPGVYHTHLGMWCGDELARASFKNAMKGKYQSIEELNKSWRYFYKSFDEVEPFLQHKAPSRTAWFDLVEWYRNSMTDFVEFWMKTLRKYLPDTPIYMCTGGSETPEQAAMFSDQAKVVAKYNGGMRLTNEQNKFFVNFFDCNAYMHSACEFYGAYLGLEPAGPMTKEGVGSRIFGSAVYGNRQIFFYFDNIYPGRDMNSETAKLFKKYIPLINERKSNKQTAVLWPKYVGIMEGGRPESIRPLSEFLRKRTDYRFVNENMIADGVLEDVKLLIIPCALYTDRKTLRTIRGWVERGGILFTAGKVTDTELENCEEFDGMLGFTDKTDICGGCAKYDIPQDIPFKRFAEKKSYIAKHGYNNLADDVMPLAEKKPEYDSFFDIQSVYILSSFYRKYGKGMTISYFGDCKFDTDDQDILTSDAFPPLLDDVVSEFSKDLKIHGSEVVRGEIGGETYALYPDGEIKKVKT